jgi:hypothetical protein
MIGRSTLPPNSKPLPSQRCHFEETGHGKHPPRYIATLRADHETSKPKTHFEALRFAPGPRPPARRVFYEAGAYERLGSVQIAHKVRLAADTSTFLLPGFPVTAESAVIHPPSPFTGSATFAPTPESTFSWTGDLAVSFPGIDPIPIAGPEFHLRFCTFRGCIDQRSPAEREEPPY